MAGSVGKGTVRGAALAGTGPPPRESLANPGFHAYLALHLRSPVPQLPPGQGPDLHLLNPHPRFSKKNSRLQLRLSRGFRLKGVFVLLSRGFRLTGVLFPPDPVT